MTKPVSEPPAMVLSTGTTSWIAVNAKLDDKLCFIATPYPRPDRDKSLEIETIERAILAAVSLTDPPLHAVLANWTLTQAEFMDSVHELIRNAKITVAVLPEPNLNVMYEIGFAHALGKPVLILKRDSAAIPANIAGQALRTYGDPQLADSEGLRCTIRLGVEEVLKQSRPTHVQHLSDIDYYLGNPMFRRNFRTVLGFAQDLSKDLAATRRNFLDRIKQRAEALDQPFEGEGSVEDLNETCDDLKVQLQPYKTRAPDRPIDLGRLNQARASLKYLQDKIKSAQWNRIELDLNDCETKVDKYRDDLTALANVAQGLSEEDPQHEAREIHNRVDEIYWQVGEIEGRAHDIAMCMIRVLDGMPKQKL